MEKVRLVLSFIDINGTFCLYMLSKVREIERNIDIQINRVREREGGRRPSTIRGRNWGLAWFSLVWFLCLTVYQCSWIIKCRSHPYRKAVMVLILLYGCTTWTLTKRLKKKLDGNYKRMLRAILNKSWQQHPTRHQLYGHLPPITKTI